MLANDWNPDIVGFTGTIEDVPLAKGGTQTGWLGGGYVGQDRWPLVLDQPNPHATSERPLPIDRHRVWVREDDIEPV